MARPGSSTRTEKPTARPERPSTPLAVGAEWADLLRLLPGYDPFRNPGDSWFDAGLAQRAIDFVQECCRHVEGALAGQTIRLEPWQRSFVANLFGWVRKDSKGRTVRRYREGLLYVPRKNGKTPLAAAIALYVLFCDAEAGQQNYVAAASREQASLLFRQCKGMVEQEPELQSRCELYGGRAEAGQSKSIVLKRDGSFLRVISADANTKHGGNAHLVLIDELHAQPDGELVEVLTTSTASDNRAQPLVLYMTTADYDRPSACNKKHAEACRVRDGANGDPSFLPAVYETLKGEDHRDEKVWEKANPNLDVSVSRDYLRREFANADGDPARTAGLKRLHLNLKTESASAAIDLARWDEAPAFDPAELEGMECWAGLDLSSTTDVTALVLLFWLERLGAYACLPFFWVPRERARERGRTDRVEYEAWGEQGHLTLTPGDVVDYDAIVAQVEELATRYQIRAIAADQWNATQTLIKLAQAGLTVEKFVQGIFSFNGPTKELGKLVASRRLLHNGHPVLRWMAGNLVVEKDASGNERPTKKKSAEKIDGMVSLVMALGKAMPEVAAGTAAPPTAEVW
jgi:phage terminase large subunit-like protein